AKVRHAEAKRAARTRSPSPPFLGPSAPTRRLNLRPLVALPRLPRAAARGEDFLLRPLGVGYGGRGGLLHLAERFLGSQAGSALPSQSGSPQSLPVPSLPAERARLPSGENRRIDIPEGLPVRR